MATSTLEVVIKGRDLLTPAVNSARNSLTGLGRTADGLKGSILTGIGLGAGVGAFGLLTEAVQRSIDVLGGAVRSAMDEQAGMSRLTIAVRDAIPAWDGNTEAIQKAIQARIGLGFNDDSLRASFTGLVARTKDVNEALRLQAVAMDIARFRGVDLEAASIAVGKAFQGSGVALQRMGIAVQAGASGEEALAQAIAATRGQAEAYADTSAGRMEGAQGRVNEAMQRFGGVLLPIVADAADNVTNAVNALTGAMDNYAPSVDNARDRTFDLAQILGNLFNLITFSPIPGLLSELDNLINGEKYAAAAAAQLAAEQDADRVAVGRATPPTNAYAGALGRMGTQAQLAGEKIAGLTSDLNRYTTQYMVTVTGFRIGMSGPEYQKSLNDSVLAQREWIAQQTKAATAASSVSSAVDKQRDALQRVIDYLKRLDDAQQRVFERTIRNLESVIDRQLAAIDAARAARDDARQQQQDARDLAAAQKAVADASRTGSIDAIRRAQQSLADVRARIEEAQTRKREDELKRQLQATKDYIDAVADLEKNATNRKALAGTLAAREKVLTEQRAAAVAAGNADLVGMIDAKLAAIRAAEERNQQAITNAKAQAKAQEYLTVHTVINLDGKKIAEIVDKYLGRGSR